MDIPDKLNLELKKIMAESQCPVDFACYKSKFGNVCKAKNMGIEGFAYCLEELDEAQRCRFSLSFGYRYLCKCRLRIYAARYLDV